MKLKKIETAENFLNTNAAAFRCPICHETVSASINGLVCTAGHCFDLSKKGTLYFLQHQIKTEYTSDMLAARGRMIQRGIFKPLVDLIRTWLTASEQLVVDVGCGEGGFLQQLQQDNLNRPAIGFDISKEGIYLASAQDSPNSFWCVADLTNLPFSDQSVTTILNIFSPSHYQEFKRVLTPTGSLIKVIPAAHYLKELRTGFLSEEKLAYSNEPVLDRLATETTILQTKRLTYQFDIPDELAFQDLLAMSPLAWQATSVQKADLTAHPFTKITIDLQLIQCRP